MIIIPAILAAILFPLSLLWVTDPSLPPLTNQTINRIYTHKKVVALTYDDGPSKGFTEKILEVLKKQDVRATFFCVGERIEKNTDLFKQIYLNGHEIGNHTWSHELLLMKKCKFIKEQIQKTDNLIKSLGYEKTIFFRPPYGQGFVNLHNCLEKTKRKSILFDAYGYDWDKPGVKRIVKRILKKTKPGSIILLHDGPCSDPKQVVPATEILIKKLKSSGYRFVTISELLEIRTARKAIKKTDKKALKLALSEKNDYIVIAS